MKNQFCINDHALIRCRWIRKWPGTRRRGINIPSQQHQYQYHQSHTSNLNISSSNATTSSTSSRTQSVYQRFLAAGGTEEMWEKIVLPESGGNPNASNGQYHGLGQTTNHGGMDRWKPKLKA